MTWLLMHGTGEEEEMGVLAWLTGAGGDQGQKQPELPECARGSWSALSGYPDITERLS